MITLRKAAERGHAQHGWLDSYHSFSFADYFDPAHMGVGNLRVINEDRVAAGSGFGTHGHSDMEIVSYVLDGELSHKDSISTGSGGVIRPGEVQRMSAGAGVRHSEFNHSPDRATHFLQIWILPKVLGIAPSYEQKHFDPAEHQGRLRLIASPDGRDGSLLFNADAAIEVGLFDGVQTVSKTLDPQRLTYVHVARGDLEVNGMKLGAGDAVTLDGETQLVLANGRQAEVLVFDLARTT